MLPRGVPLLFSLATVFRVSFSLELNKHTVARAGSGGPCTGQTPCAIEENVGEILLDLLEQHEEEEGLRLEIEHDGFDTSTGIGFGGGSIGESWMELTSEEVLSQKNAGNKAPNNATNVSNAPTNSSNASSTGKPVKACIACDELHRDYYANPVTLKDLNPSEPFPSFYGSPGDCAKLCAKQLGGSCQMWSYFRLPGDHGAMQKCVVFTKPVERKKLVRLAGAVTGKMPCAQKAGKRMSHCDFRRVLKCDALKTGKAVDQRAVLKAGNPVRVGDPIPAKTANAVDEAYEKTVLCFLIPEL